MVEPDQQRRVNKEAAQEMRQMRKRSGKRRVQTFAIFQLGSEKASNMAFSYSPSSLTSSLDASAAPAYYGLCYRNISLFSVLGYLNLFSVCINSLKKKLGEMNNIYNTEFVSHDSCPLCLTSLVPRPHPLTRRNGLVNQVKFLGLAGALATL